MYPSLLIFCILFQCLFILTTGCTKSQLPKYVELDQLRVLTLIADKPEVGPGETVTITPVISDIKETASLTFEAYGCIDPGVSAGAKATCDNNPTQILLGQGTITSSTSSEMSQNFSGSAPSFTLNIPASSVIFSQRSSMDQFNGVSYLVTYKVSNTSGQNVLSFKRILVSNKSSSDKNTNPGVQNILSQGQALGVNNFPLNGKFSLQMELVTGAAQSYQVQLDDGSFSTRTEEITTTWFITDGSLKYYRSNAQDTNEFTAPEALNSLRKSFLFSVTRDSRGGVSVKRVCGGC